MKTPKKYSDLVNQNKITEEILGEVIYSINKRAKNWRNQKRKYKNYLLDQYDSYDNALDNEKKYYKMRVYEKKSVNLIAFYGNIKLIIGGDFLWAERKENH